MVRTESKRQIIFIGCLFFSLGAGAVDPDSGDLKREKLYWEAEKLRVKLIVHARGYVGITEETGNNDGKEILRWQRNVGIPKGSAYCAAFVSTMFSDLSIPAPVTGWSPAMFTANVIYEKKKDWRPDYVFPNASVFGMYYQSKGRVAHVGIIEYNTSKRIMTIQANTNAFGAVDLDNQYDENIREGDGVFRKWVARDVIYVVSDYIGGPLMLYDWRKNGEFRK